MPSIDVFGKIFVSRSLETQISDTLQTWFPTYLREVESQLSLPVGFLTPPRSYTYRNKFDALPGEELPKVVVMSDSLQGTPEKSGNGQYTAWWRLGVGVATAEKDEDTADFNAKIYAAVARAIVVQKGGRVEWLTESYVDLPITSQLLQYKAAALWFAIEVQNVVTRKSGPSQPNQEPYSYHTADTIDIELAKGS